MGIILTRKINFTVWKHYNEEAYACQAVGTRKHDRLLNCFFCIFRLYYKY